MTINRAAVQYIREHLSILSNTCGQGVPGLASQDHVKLRSLRIHGKHDIRAEPFNLNR